MTDYSLWEVIKNGNKVLKRTVRIVEQIYEPTSTEEKLNRKKEMKAIGTLLMALSNKDQLKFHSYPDAKLLMEAIEKRYGGNKEYKKVQRTLLKQQYENFAVSSLKTLDQTFYRLQKFISQLEIQDIETISLDDLYNNLNIYKPEHTGSSSTSQNPQNIAFVSSNNANSTSNTNEADNTAYEVSTAHTQGNIVNSTSVDNLSDAVICAFLASQPNSPQLARDDLEQIDSDDLEEMDLHWEMAMLTIRARRAPKNQENKGREYGRKTVLVENPTENALIAQDGIGGQVSDKVKTRLGYKAVSHGVESFVSSSEILESQENVKSRSDKGYHAVPSPYTGNYIPPKPDLTFIDEQVESDSVDVVSNVASSDVKTVESKHKSVDVKNKGVYSTIETKPVRKNSFSPPIIED
nr:ribonuclease H-like domain-containing protein [Tanacetum cinerariifolium]